MVGETGFEPAAPWSRTGPRGIRPLVFGWHAIATSGKYVCTAVVYRLCEKGELHALRIGGALRFEPDAVRKYAERTRL